MLTDFHWNEAIFFEKKIQNGCFSKWTFFKIANSQNFYQKFHRLVLGLGGLIDAKASNVAQPIWLGGCLT